GEGRLFNESELNSGAAVCLVGSTVRRELFGAQNPIGSKIRIKKMSCEVIGLLQTKGQSAMGTDQDDLVVMPLRTFQRRISGSNEVNIILVSAKDGYSTEKAQEALKEVMRERRHISSNRDDDFSVMDMKEIANMMTGTSQVLTMLLSAVAAVSLVVGGIGIMNIMLVSVTERTREIGIRLAIGALEREVMMQFLVEAVVLSSLGGVVGIIIALITSLLIVQSMQVPFLFSPGIVTIAFLFSALVGIVFGYFPARKAANLNPIDALRHE
ncbi:MAG TPA: ABC transporter permease, partial [Dongiaceae bacterium]|nr:ABC transporter permease [Dongiaceae bacterium]